jgi:hypothetical protein
VPTLIWAFVVLISQQIVELVGILLQNGDRQGDKPFIAGDDDDDDDDKQVSRQSPPPHCGQSYCAYSSLFP